MKFISTRGKSFAQNASEAIVKGLADDGGLFVPEFFPDLTSKFNDLLEMDYPNRSATILSSFLDEYDYNGLLKACQDAYSTFDGDPAPVVKIDDNLFILELFHGPTLAFKDIALTLLPYLLRQGSLNIKRDEKVMILVATSGDTGKAALEGFKDKEGVKICVLYPSLGVSDMQKSQMQTQEGENVFVLGVNGNFDDCQTTVKKIFSNKEINAKLKEKGVVLSSANSINFGRLAPQIVYYFSSYFDLVSNGEIKMGDKVDFIVPTGNFGDILAGFYAKKMGLPVGKLVCASNSNNVLTEFFNSGNYDSLREFYKTISPSMDILISSNLERLIFEYSDRNFELTAKRMTELKDCGRYSISKDELKEISKTFYAGYCDEEETKQAICDFYDEYGYVLDTHTAVAVNIYKEYNDGKSNPCVVLSTASFYKFGQSVYESLTKKKIKDPFIATEKLNEMSAVPIPKQISELKTKEKRFVLVKNKEDIEKTVIDFALKDKR